MEPYALRFKNASSYVGSALCVLVTEDLPNMDRWKSRVEESKGVCVCVDPDFIARMTKLTR